VSEVKICRSVIRPLLTNATETSKTWQIMETTEKRILSKTSRKTRVDRIRSQDICENIEFKESGERIKRRKDECNGMFRG
jgi:hypothetical protein